MANEIATGGQWSPFERIKSHERCSYRIMVEMATCGVLNYGDYRNLKWQRSRSKACFNSGITRNEDDFI